MAGPPCGDHRQGVVPVPTPELQFFYAACDLCPRYLLTNLRVEALIGIYNGDQWVQVEILVMNDSIISHYINGERVLTYSKPRIGGGNVDIPNELLEPQQGTALKKGTISLQSESHPVEFRNIEILEL